MLKIKRSFRHAFNSILGGYPTAFSAEKTIKDNIEKIENSISEINLNNVKLSLDSFRNQQNRCLENKKLIEVKANTCLFGITLAFSIVFASFNLMINESFNIIFDGIKILIILPGIIGIVFLLFGGIAAVQALKIREWYDLSLKEEAEFDNSISQKNDLVNYIKSNDLTNIIRSNYTEASQNLIIRGILFLGAFIILLVLIKII